MFGSAILCVDDTYFFISNSDYMLTAHQKEQFIPRLKEIIEEGLKRLKVIDTLQEKVNAFPNLTGKLSEQDIDLDYQSLDIERYEHDSLNKVHTFRNVWWSTRHRALQYGHKIVGNSLNRPFWGIIPEIRVKVDYDDNTDTFELTLLNDFDSSAKERH